jgi:hypothetical protein
VNPSNYYPWHERRGHEGYWKWIAEVVNEVKNCQLPETKEERIAYLKQFKKDIAGNQRLKELKERVVALCSRFPLPY